MNPANDHLSEQLRSNPRPLPRADLAAQIVQQATAHPQRTHWLQRWQRALSEPGYGWQFKLASLALCGMLGLYAGQAQDSRIDSELLLSAQMLDSALTTEEP